MDRIRAEHLVVHVERSIGTDGHAGGAEEVAAFDEWNAFGSVARAFSSEREVVDAVIAPAWDHDTAAEFCESAGAFATRMHHAERAA